MKKSVILLPVGICFCILSFAQSLDRTVLASSGGSDKTNTISLDWTLGELATETVSASGKMYSQGFQQSILLGTSNSRTTSEETKSVVTSDIDGYRIVVAPNPVTSIVNFRISSSKNINVTVTVSDVNGALLKQRATKSDAGNLQIDMSGFAAGMYFLTVKDVANNRILQTFKLVKVQ